MVAAAQERQVYIKMKILITGAGGMLGTDLVQQLSRKHQLVGTGRRPAVHLAIPYQLNNIAFYQKAFSVVESVKPDIILHAASMTEVDQCETDRRSALADNFEATRNITEAGNKVGALVIYFSTDFVFDGSKPLPYTEQDAPNPVSVYGETKLLAERFLLIKGKKFLILRTSWLFGKHGDNFPKKILKQAEAGKPIRVVADQFGNPTYTGDLADAVEKIIEGVSSGTAATKLNQIYHVANEGVISRYEFARAILKHGNFSQDLLSPVSSDEINQIAQRPRNSALSTDKIGKHFGVRLRPWEAALDAYFQEELGSVNK